MVYSAANGGGKGLYKGLQWAVPTTLCAGKEGLLQGLLGSAVGLLEGVVAGVMGRATRSMWVGGGVSSYFTRACAVKLLDKATPWVSPKRRKPRVCADAHTSV